jgi:YVTN family beta-propeller protein
MVNLTTNRVVTVIPDDGLPPDVVTPDGTTYLVDAAYNGFVFVLDAAGNLVTTIDVGGSPYGLTLGTDTSEVYVFNVDTVSVIDTNTNKVVKTDSAPPNPFGGVTVSSGQLTEVK